MRELEERLEENDGSSKREKILQLKITALQSGMETMEQFAKAVAEASEEQKRKASKAITNTNIILESLDGIAASQDQPASPQTANAKVADGYVSDSEKLSQIASELLEAGSTAGNVGSQIVFGMRTQPPFERKSGFVERKWYTLDQLLKRKHPKKVPMKDWARGRKQAVKDLLEKNDGCDVFRFSNVGDEEAPLGITPKGSLPDSGFEKANKWMQTVWMTIVSAHVDGVFDWAVDSGGFTVDHLIDTLNDKAMSGQSYLRTFVVDLHREMPKSYVPRRADGKADDDDKVSSLGDKSESETEFSKEYDGSNVGLNDAPSKGRLAVYEDDDGLHFCLSCNKGKDKLDPVQWFEGSYGGMYGKKAMADKQSHGKCSHEVLYNFLGYSLSQGSKMRDLYDIFLNFARLSSTPVDEHKFASPSILAWYVDKRMDGPKDFNNTMKTATYEQIWNFFEKVTESHSAQVAVRVAKVISTKRAATAISKPTAVHKKMRAK